MPALLVRAASLGLVLAAFQLLPDTFSLGSWEENFHIEGVSDLAMIFTTWDGAHYIHLATSGYAPGQMSNAFFPLWPSLIRIVAPLAGGNAILAGVLLANLLGAAAAVLLHRLAMHRVSESTADTAVLFLLACPGAMFLTVPYTEALFLVLGLVFLLGLAADRYEVAGVAAFLLALTRPPGLLVLIPFVVHVGVRAWRARAISPRMLWVLAPGVGWLAWLGWMHLATGNALAGLEAQGRFQTDSTVGMITDVPRFLEVLFSFSTMHGYGSSLIERMIFFAYVFSLPLVWRMNRTWFWFVLPLGMVPAVTVSLVAFARYFLVLAPVCVAVAALFDRPSLTRWRWPLLGLLAGLQIILLVLHTSNLWAG